MEGGLSTCPLPSFAESLTDRSSTTRTVRTLYVAICHTLASQGCWNRAKSLAGAAEQGSLLALFACLPATF